MPSVTTKSAKRPAEDDPDGPVPVPKKPKKTAQPKRRKRVTKAEIRRRRTTFFSLPRELCQDIVWKMNEYPEIRGQSPKGVVNNDPRCFHMETKNCVFKRWTKTMKRINWMGRKEEMAEDLDYLEGKWKRIHRVVYPRFDEDIRLHHIITSPVPRDSKEKENRRLYSEARDAILKRNRSRV